MAATVRLSPELQAWAATYAVRVGISVNGLLAVALVEYLTSHDLPFPGSQSTGQEAISGPVARSAGEAGPNLHPKAGTQPGLSKRQRKRQARADRAKGKR